jgi:hypothetical protein
MVAFRWRGVAGIRPTAKRIFLPDAGFAPR